MPFAEVLAAAFSVFFTHTASVRLGNGTLSAADAAGKPSHLTFAQVVAAAEMAFAGQPASIASGDITLTYTPNVPA